MLELLDFRGIAHAEGIQVAAATDLELDNGSLSTLKNHSYKEERKKEKEKKKERKKQGKRTCKKQTRMERKGK